ncbi:probable beta-D-xylosidase 7 [Phoenix dactylifera]|uniref:Probable beta-D-xylosidase 7 n=1 Tax=Phoenix dactylifera TaxID=42345 RepID=A0A8B7CWQ9_PHODC|nr:probable beta-D-xylosidase 7 [Phoenix dactylifera]
MRIPKELHFLLFYVLLPQFLVLSADPPFSCDPSSPSTNSFTFCKTTSLPIDKRVDDLIAHLTLEEKIAQLGDIAPSIPRLGIPAYKWWSESLHGVSDSGRGIHFNGTIHSATSFPQVILTAASFNPRIWYQIGQAIGIEARAVYNNGQAEGLTFWSPNINIFRDPRWGRGQETPGEDPMTTSKYAAVYVRGLQGDSFKGGSSAELKASACCKHFTAYDLDNWKGNIRYTFNALVSAQDFEDTYQPPFKSCVEEGRASGIMCSYNRVNGVPTCADHNLLSKTARGSWGFYGYITSDCDAVSIIHDSQGYAKTPEDAVGDVLKAGMDVNCGNYVQKYAKSAVQQGKLSEGDINRALHNLFSIRMRLGLFNGNPKYEAYGKIAPSQVCTQKHQNLALEAARDGIVLLKNSVNILPLSKSKVKSLGVIGLNANNATKLLGNYAGPPCKSITPLEALQSYVKDTRYLSGCDTAACTSSSTSEAVQLARSVDYVVMFMGLDLEQEREDLDRVDLVLPGMQQSLITSVARAAKRPVILVLLCGGPVDITFAKYEKKIGGILWAGYPGEAGGLAIAQVIFGEHNPGGRLPVTWYPQSFTSVPMTDMRMRADPASGYPGRTYRFYTGKPVYSFGFGLSYSTYSYEFSAESENKIYLNKSISLDAFKMSGSLSYDITNMGSEACKKLKFSTVVGVKNHGPMDGKHPVLLFLRWPNALYGRPMKQLIGFQSVHLKAGERADVKFVVSPCKHLGRTNIDGAKLLDQGSHFLMTGKKEYQISIMA